MEELELKLGEYKHYKGGMYRVLSIATHTETTERMVVYQDSTDPSKIWVRPIAIFTDKVIKDGMKIPRFKYMGK